MNHEPLHIAILCNPVAGNGRANLLGEKIANELLKKQIGHLFFQQNWPESLDSFTDAWIVGGDGTLNYFINHYREIKIPLVIFKGGSGNDFHWLLYGEKGFEEQINISLTADPKPIDAGYCNDKIFINGVGIGFDGAIAKNLAGINKLPGKTSYYLAILKNIFFYNEKKYSLQSEELNISGRYLLISVANGKRYGGGFQVAPLAEPGDGLLDVNLVRALHIFRRLRYLPVIEKGRHVVLPFVKYYQSKKIVIESEETMQAHLDGEYYPRDRFEIGILPAKFLFRY